MPTCPNWIQTNGNVIAQINRLLIPKSCKWVSADYPLLPSSPPSLPPGGRRYAEPWVFVVQTAIASGSIDLAASFRHNQSPSQRQCRSCSAALESYLRLITSQRACHLGVLWHLNPMYTAPRWKGKKERLTFLSLGTASMPAVYPEMGASKE